MTSEGTDSEFEKDQWSPKRTLRFIERYRREEALWNSQHLYYKRENVRRKAYSSIAQDFSIDVRNVKMKIKTLRSAFYREHKRIMNNSCGDVSKKWFGYEPLHFILSKDALDRLNWNIASSMYSNVISEIPVEFIEEGSSTVTIRQPRIVKELASNKELPSDPRDQLNQDFQSKSNIFIRNRNMFKSSKIQPKEDKLKQAERSKKLYSILEKLKKDEYQIFGEHVANEIRKLGPQRQTIVKHQISQVLFEAAMGKYNEPVSTISSENHENEHDYS